MATTQLAFLGPLGTYSHLVAEKRFGRNYKTVPLPTVLDVCTFVAEKRNRCGVVPIENSSGGAIYETVDILLQNNPRIHVDEEITLNVQLALLGRKGEDIKVLYSHFAPMEHCHPWIMAHLPEVRRVVVSSTAAAAERASIERYAVALGNRRLAGIYDLDVLRYPVAPDTPNITTFLVISGAKRPVERPNKTTLAAKLPNMPGSLCTFLETFRNQNVNLSRLISRPIRGCPREYAFLVDVEGSHAMPKVKRAITAARKTCTELRTVGSYPSRRSYKS